MSGVSKVGLVCNNLSMLCGPVMFVLVVQPDVCSSSAIIILDYATDAAHTQYNDTQWIKQ